MYSPLIVSAAYGTVQHALVLVRAQLLIDFEDCRNIKGNNDYEMPSTEEYEGKDSAVIDFIGDGIGDGI